MTLSSLHVSGPRQLNMTHPPTLKDLCHSFMSAVGLGSKCNNMLAQTRSTKVLLGVCDTANDCLPRINIFESLKRGIYRLIQFRVSACRASFNLRSLGSVMSEFAFGYLFWMLLWVDNPPLRGSQSIQDVGSSLNQSSRCSILFATSPWSQAGLSKLCRNLKRLAALGSKVGGRLELIGNAVVGYLRELPRFLVAQERDNTACDSKWLTILIHFRNSIPFLFLRWALMTTFQCSILF